MATLSEEQVAKLWLDAGGPRDAVGYAVAVATAESGRKTDNVNPQSGATGLWQIHPGGPRYKNPQLNARTAVSKYKARKWQPWSVCGSGAWSAGEPNCPKLKDEAAAVMARLGGSTAGLTTAAITMPNPGDVIGGAGDVLDGLKAVGSFFVELARKIGDPQTWIDIGKIIAGTILLWMGVKRILEVSV